MLRLLKQCWWVVVLATGTMTASAFSLLGPFNEDYQVQVLTYQTPGDIGAPKNLGEEYRWNKPTLYYSFDQNFLDFFGSNGVYSVDQAMAVFNALTNVSKYSSDLSEFPLEARRFNYRAQALGLVDIKSLTMNLVIEQLGLAEAQRYTWTLHFRDHIDNTPPCPEGMVYLVVKRNFEISPTALDQYQESSYVNGTLFSYFISEACTGTPYLADAVEFSVDPLAVQYSPVSEIFGLDLGVFYTGLTRDDIAGLRYLLRTNNMNIENAGAGTTTFATNLNTSQLLVTSNLTLLAAQALTNDAAALTTLYPDLVIASSIPVFTNVVTTNAFAYYTNYPWSPAGSPATLVYATNYTTNVETWYQHSFANVVTNSYYTNGILRLQTTTVGQCPLAPPGLICTNVTTKVVATNLIVGDYFILPTNSACGFEMVRTQLVTVFTITNDIVTATNAPGTTNVNGQQFSQSTISYFTNHVFVVHPVDCVDNSLALRQGVERVRFVRRDFDSLIGQYFAPITNSYTLVAITNSTAVPQLVRRVVAQPDLLFTAQDMLSGPSGLPYNDPWARRSISFDEDNILAGLAGPGTINPGVHFIFNKRGQMFVNYSLAFLEEISASKAWTYGSFDGTTNTPVVYPNGASVVNLENQVLIQVQPSAPSTNGVVYLPNGTVGSAYSTVFSGFTATGGQPPYSWALAPGSPALPPNLILNANGTISGTPAAGTAGLTFDFVIRMTEAGARFVDRSFAITINP